MCILNKISDLLKQQHKTQKDLTDYLGLTKNSYSNWKNGNNNSYIKYLPSIAEFLNVSVDFLIGKEKSPLSEESGLSGDEQLKEIISLYSQLDEPQRKILLAAVRGIAQGE